MMVGAEQPQVIQFIQGGLRGSKGGFLLFRETVLRHGGFLHRSGGFGDYGGIRCGRRVWRGRSAAGGEEQRYAQQETERIMLFHKIHPFVKTFFSRYRFDDKFFPIVPKNRQTSCRFFLKNS